MGYGQYYQQYLSGGSNKSGQGGYQQYYQQYMGGGKNSSSKSNTGSYQKYYQKYIGGSSKSVEQVTSCSTDTCVKEWYKAKKAEIKKFVPKDYQHFQLTAIEKEY